MTRPRPQLIAGSSRPWQVTVAVLLIAGWWVGSFSHLIALDGGAGRDDLGPLLGLGLWTLVVLLLLRSTWRGGRATGFVAGAALLLGIGYEITGLVVAVIWFVDPLTVPLWTSLLLMVIAACPLYGGRLLRTRAARRYRDGELEASVDGDGGAGDGGAGGAGELL